VSSRRVERRGKERYLFAKSGIGSEASAARLLGTTREMPVGVSAYLVPVDALQRGLDLRLRERGWMA
jgi:hypothetical protein